MPKSIALAALLVALLPTAAVAQQSSANYRAYISTPQGQIDSGPSSPVPVSVEFDSVVGDGGRFVGSASASGGMRPLALASGSRVGYAGASRGDYLRAEVNYSFRVEPIRGSTRTTVPITITAAGEASISPNTPENPVRGGAGAFVTIRGATHNDVPLNEGVSVSSNTLAGDADSFSVIVPAVAIVGSTYGVQKRAFVSIVQDSDATAVVDPVIQIDPDATFEENGEIRRYADEFSIEYSETIGPACDDGVDNDGDGGIDFVDADGDGVSEAPGDLGCAGPDALFEDPVCQDGLDNDGDGGVDFDGGASLDLDDDGFVDAVFNPDTPALGDPDAQCMAGPSWNREGPGGCGLGAELALLLPLTRWLRRRRRVLVT